MSLKSCIYDGSGTFSLADHPTSARIPKEEKEHYLQLTAENTARMAELQDRLYADGREGLVILFQALDAAGKDSTIKHVMSGVNPQGVSVTSFKTPSKTEAAHDFLWRESMVLPERGHIAIFNRSYYEECLVVRVHGIWRSYAMPARITQMSEKDYFDARYRSCVDFEENLWYGGYRVLKFFLNVGRNEQRKRFLDRIDDPAKNWKFSEGDLDERDLWPSYQAAFESMISATSTKHAPWYVIPADQKFYMRWLVSEAIVKELEDINPQYPSLPNEQVERLAVCRARLEADKA